MGFRFRHSISLGSGLRINLSKSGASLSVGRRGATMNFGPKGRKVTLGLPGTGLSYSDAAPWADDSERRSLPVPARVPPKSPPAPLATPVSARGFNRIMAVTIAVLIVAAALAYIIH